MTSFQVRYHPLVAEKDLPGLDPAVRKKIQRAVERRLFTHPEKYGLPLRHTLKGLRKLRVGDWRVIYRISGSEVWILRIGHRQEVYRHPPRSLQTVMK